MNLCDLQSAIEHRDARLLAEREDEAEREERRAAAITAAVARIAADSLENPAYGAYIVVRAEVPLHEIRVRLHGESMTWERAVFDLLHMAARRDDPEAIAVAAELLRAEVGSAISSDAAVYGMAATTVAMGEDN